MNLEEIKDKSIALIVWNAEKVDDVRVYLGRLKILDGKYAFINEEEGWKVSLYDEHLSRLRPVSEDLKEILLNADYGLSMSMGVLLETDDRDGWVKTGLKWKK